MCNRISRTVFPVAVVNKLMFRACMIVIVHSSVSEPNRTVNSSCLMFTLPGLI